MCGWTARRGCEWIDRKIGSSVDVGAEDVGYSFARSDDDQIVGCGPRCVSLSVWLASDEEGEEIDSHSRRLMSPRMP